MPQFDLIVFGATSFVGKIVCEYLTELSQKEKFTWAIAARSEKKLEELKTSLGKQAESVTVIIADSHDEESLRNMCKQAQVVASTVGPYALLGETLVKACAETGTHYCDLTGEPQWIRKMIDRYEEAAKKSGAYIVHCCGFDSIPSDLGVFFLQKEAMKAFQQPCQEVTMRVKGAKGGFSGGTAASLLNAAKEAAHDKDIRRQLSNPYALLPKGAAPSVKQHKVMKPEFDENFKSWVGPFVMESVNVQIVHRSHALSDFRYGREFRYNEGVLMGTGAKGRLSALGMTVGLGALLTGASLPPTRWALERFVFPKPGEGPNEHARKTGFYDMRFYGVASDGKFIRTKVKGDADPGYGSTAKMLAQAALCLSHDIKNSGQKGGFWTPSSLLGEKLLNRLHQSAGVSFELLEVSH